MDYLQRTCIVVNLRGGVCVGDVLTVKDGEVFRGQEKVSFDLSRKVIGDGKYTVGRICGQAPGERGYYV